MIWLFWRVGNFSAENIKVTDLRIGKDVKQKHSRRTIFIIWAILWGQNPLCK